MSASFNNRCLHISIHVVEIQLKAYFILYIYIYTVYILNILRMPRYQRYYECWLKQNFPFKSNDRKLVMIGRNKKKLKYTLTLF